jgi:hypothetical protein
MKNKGFLLTVFLDFVFNCFLIGIVIDDKKNYAMLFIKATILTIITSAIFWYVFYRGAKKSSNNSS